MPDRGVHLDQRSLRHVHIAQFHGGADGRFHTAAGYVHVTVMPRADVNDLLYAVYVGGKRDEVGYGEMYLLHA